MSTSTQSPPALTARFILRAIRRKYPQNALVPEVVLADDAAYDRYWEGYNDGAHPIKTEPLYRRIDALMFQSFERTAIEIKVSRTDWARDTPSKRSAWQRVVHRFIYVVPAGLEPPPGHFWLGSCGIWWVHDDGRITVHRKARITKHPEHLPQQIIQALAYRATPSLTTETEKEQS